MTNSTFISLVIIDIGQLYVKEYPNFFGITGTTGLNFFRFDDKRNFMSFTSELGLESPGTVFDGFSSLMARETFHLQKKNCIRKYYYNNIDN